MRQITIDCLELLAEQSKTGDDDDKSVASMLFCIMGSFHSGSLRELNNLMTEHAKYDLSCLKETLRNEPAK